MALPSIVIFNKLIIFGNKKTKGRKQDSKHMRLLDMPAGDAPLVLLIIILLMKL
jgi:hypothetical protein